MMTMSKMREEIMRERKKKKEFGRGRQPLYNHHDNDDGRMNDFIYSICVFFCWWNETRFGSVTHTQ